MTLSPQGIDKGKTQVYLRVNTFPPRCQSSGQVWFSVPSLPGVYICPWQKAKSIWQLFLTHQDEIRDIPAAPVSTTTTCTKMGGGVVAGKATQSTGIEPYYLMLWLCKSKRRAQKWSSKTLKLVIPYSKKTKTQQAFNCQPMTSPAWFNNSSSQQIFGDLYTLTHKHTRICTCDVSPLWL